MIKQHPEWIDELEKVMCLCVDARVSITVSDPNMEWKVSCRGDWMLFYIFVATVSRLQSRGLEHFVASTAATVETNAIAEHVGCPCNSTIPFGEGRYVWNTLSPFGSYEELAQLADRIRKIWPDIPLVV